MGFLQGEAARLGAGWPAACTQLQAGLQCKGAGVLVARPPDGVTSVMHKNRIIATARRRPGVWP